MVESQNYSKLVNITKKQTHRSRGETNGYQWEGGGIVYGQRTQRDKYQVESKLRGYIVQHKRIQPIFYNNF